MCLVWATPNFKWLVDHVINTDTKIAAYCKSKGMDNVCDVAELVAMLESRQMGPLPALPLGYPPPSPLSRGNRTLNAVRRCPVYLGAPFFGWGGGALFLRAETHSAASRSCNCEYPNRLAVCA